MPRPLLPHRVPKSAEYLLSRKIIGVPTPWIKTMWVQDGVENVVVYRLFQRRRGHTIMLQTHAQSPAYRAKLMPINASRQGLFEMRDAAAKLIALSHKTPESWPNDPKYRWDRAKPDFLNGQTYQRVVDQMLYTFLNPKRGRPKNPPLIGNAGAGLPVGTRLARRREILEYVTRMEDLTNPLYARVQNGRMMRGYDGHQRSLIEEHVRLIALNVAKLRDRVYFESEKSDSYQPAVPASVPEPVPTMDVSDLWTPPLNS